MGVLCVKAVLTAASHVASKHCGLARVRDISAARSACPHRLGVRAQVEYKQTYKLRSTEDAFAALEDNTVTLSTMKASKFFVVFEKDITHWEQTLSLVSEAIETVQQVQRSWQYLENIFVGSEDIRKQLPQESVLFDAVHTTFMERMAQLAEHGNIVRACTAPGMLDAFNGMDARLEKIQKSLENYLEAKRQQFPRFYFLSSDDLLEILGQAKDPQNVQSHLKKCFEGVKRLTMHAPGAEGRREWESSAVSSPDGCAPCLAGEVDTSRVHPWRRLRWPARAQGDAAVQCARGHGGPP